MAYYQATCTKSRILFGPGGEETSCDSEETLYGSFETLRQANVMINIKRAELEKRDFTENVWTGGQLDDGCLWYNCDDFGRGEFYKFRIKKHIVSEIDPSLAHHPAAPELWGGGGDRLELQELDVLDRFKLMLENDDTREEILSSIGQQINASDQYRIMIEDSDIRLDLLRDIDEVLHASDQFRILMEDDDTRDDYLRKIDHELDFSDQFQVLMDDNDTRERYLGDINEELDASDQFRILMEDKDTRVGALSNIIEELDNYEQLQLILENDNGRQEALSRFDQKLSFSEQFQLMLENERTRGQVLDHILNAEGGTKEILSYLRRSTGNIDGQFEDLVLGKIAEKDQESEVPQTPVSRRARTPHEVARRTRRRQAAKLRRGARIRDAKSMSESGGSSSA